MSEQPDSIPVIIETIEVEGDPGFAVELILELGQQPRLEIEYSGISLLVVKAIAAAIADAPIEQTAPQEDAE